MSYVVHKEFQKMIKLPNKKPVIEEVSMNQTYDGNKANISLHMRKNDKKRDVSLSLNNDEIIQLMKNRPSIDEMLHKRLTQDFSSILNGHLQGRQKPSMFLNRQFPVLEISTVGTKSSGRSMGSNKINKSRKFNRGKSMKKHSITSKKVMGKIRSKKTLKSTKRDRSKK
jgi:hypothetical protein